LTGGQLQHLRPIQATGLFEIDIFNDRILTEFGFAKPGLHLPGLTEADGLIQLRKGEEPLVSQFGKDLPLNDLDRSFNLGFVARGANPGRQDRHTVMRGHVLEM
jgi:hypothetical protein